MSSAATTAPSTVAATERSTLAAAEWQPVEYVSGEPSTFSPRAFSVVAERGPSELLTSVAGASSAPKMATVLSNPSVSSSSNDQPAESVRSLRAQFEAPQAAAGGGGMHNERAVTGSRSVQSVTRPPASGVVHVEGKRLSKPAAVAEKNSVVAKTESATFDQNHPVTETEKIAVVIRRATIVGGSGHSRELEFNTAQPVTDDERRHAVITRPTIVLRSPPAKVIAAPACDAVAATTVSPGSTSGNVTVPPGSYRSTAAPLGRGAPYSVAAPAASRPNDEATSVVTPSSLRSGSAAAAFWPPPPPPAQAESGSTEMDAKTPCDDDERLSVTPSSLRRGDATAAYWPPQSNLPPKRDRLSEDSAPNHFGGFSGSSRSPALDAVTSELALSPRFDSSPAATVATATAHPSVVAHQPISQRTSVVRNSTSVATPLDTAEASVSKTSSVQFESPMIFRVPLSSQEATATSAAPERGYDQNNPRRAAALWRRNDLKSVASDGSSLPTTDCERTDVVIRRPTIVLSSPDARAADAWSRETREVNMWLEGPERPSALPMSGSLSINGLEPHELNKPYGRALFQIVRSPVTPPKEVAPCFGMTDFVVSRRLLAVSECE